MLDGKVLRACLMDREAYDRVAKHISLEELSLQGQAWWPLVQEFYAADKDAPEVDTELLMRKAERDFPEQHKETLINWFKSLPDVVSAGNVVQDTLELKRYIKGNELSQAIQGRQDVKIDDLISEYTELRAATTLGRSEVTWTMDNGDMDATLNRENLIKVAPKRLNDRLGGGASPGDTILVFGRPEAGKTLFTVNMVAGFLKFGRRVLYIGNEEGTYKTRRRILNNLADCDNDQYERDPEGYIDKANKAGFTNLYICHMQPGSPAEIEEIVKEVRPEVVVIDQIRNLDYPRRGNDKLTDRLGSLATEMRNLAQRYGFLNVAVTQAGDKTERHGQEPPPWLSMSDIADNRTSLAAQYDVILGVGVTEELRRMGMRCISICKNKLSDKEDAHTGIEVQVDITKSKVR